LNVWYLQLSFYGKFTAEGANDRIPKIGKLNYDRNFVAYFLEPPEI